MAAQDPTRRAMTIASSSPRPLCALAVTLAMGLSLVGMLTTLALSTGPRIAVIGGGASGIFSAIAAAETSSAAKVVVLEAGRETLTKVAISGGGRVRLYRVYVYGCIR